MESTTELSADKPSVRLAALRKLEGPSREAAVDVLTCDSPIKPFPFGMTSSIAPMVVILGLSPGNGERLPAGSTVGKSGIPPTCGEVSEAFRFVDRSSYWPKVADIATFLVQRLELGISNDDALALVGHLNLGTGQYGAGSVAAVELPIVRWVSEILFSRLRPKILVTWGTLGVLKRSSEISKTWNHPNGLQVNWSEPHRTVKFGANAFRFWRALREDGQQVAVVMWPNHPSKPPFAGPSSRTPWSEAKAQIDALLISEGF